MTLAACCALSDECGVQMHKYNHSCPIPSRHQRTPGLAFLSPRSSIRRELERRGVVQSSKRLFWAQTFADGDAHVAGKSGSDVALDPMWFNGHSGAVDSMRSCVPLVTLPGEGMHSRVASSLALSLGGEGGGGAAGRLVARNSADYT